jgi:sensor c-di-GMP phosphodiesterase-like protein
MIAKGLKSHACLELLKQLDIDKVQGAYAKVMPYQTFIAWAQADS